MLLSFRCKYRILKLILELCFQRYFTIAAKPPKPFQVDCACGTPTDNLLNTLIAADDLLQLSLPTSLPFPLHICVATDIAGPLGGLTASRAQWMATKGWSELPISFLGVMAKYRI